MDRELAKRNEQMKIIVKADPDLADIIPGYIENRRRDLTIIKEALEKGDYDAIRVAGHQMRGSGAGYGFDALTDIGSDLEQAAKEKDRARIFSALESLADYIERVEVVYE